MNRNSTIPCPDPDDRRILLAVLEPENTPAEFLEHLAACPACRRRKEALEADLEGLRKMAGRLTPAMARPIRLPEKERKAPARLGWLAPAAGFAMAAALVLVAALYLGILGPGAPDTGQITPPRLTTNQVTVSDDAQDLALDPGGLYAATPLPPEYLLIIGEEEEVFEDGFEEEEETYEEFIDFVAPGPDAPATLGRSLLKGATPC